MAVYVYECPEHGRFDVVKPMSESGREEKCPAYVEPAYGGDLHGIGNIDTSCGRVMTRVITVPTIQGETVAGGVSGGSGDGYLLDSKTGLTSKRPRSKKWV